MIATDGHEYGCAIDSGGFEKANTFPLGLVAKDVGTGKFVDFDCGVCGRILIMGRLDHQFPDGLTTNLSGLIKERYLNACEDFDSLQSFAESLASWISRESFHNLGTRESNIAERIIYVVGKNNQGALDVFELKYDEFQGILNTLKLVDIFNHRLSNVQLHARSPLWQAIGNSSNSNIGNLLFKLQQNFDFEEIKKLLPKQVYKEIVFSFITLKNNEECIATGQLDLCGYLNSVIFQLSRIAQVVDAYVKKNGVETLSDQAFQIMATLLESSFGRPNSRII